MAVSGGLNHIHLISPDPATTAEWYVKFLGAEILGEDELRGSKNIRMMIGRTGVFIRGLRPTDNMVSTGNGRPYGVDHISFTVEGLDQMLDLVEKNGGTILEPIYTLPGGNRGAFIQAPDNVQIGLIEIHMG